jgi:nucleotide-binding universal stress UspA family protein
MKILIPLDGSEFSAEALAVVRRLFTPEDAHVTLLRVAAFPVRHDPHTPPHKDSGNWMTYARWNSYLDSLRRGEDDQRADQLEQDLRDVRAGLLDQMADAKAQLQTAGFRVSCRVHFGHPAFEISSMVRDEGFDLVIMATHGRKGVARLLMGSVAEAVLRQVTVPIIMTRPQSLTPPSQSGSQHADEPLISQP